MVRFSFAELFCSQPLTDPPLLLLFNAGLTLFICLGFARSEDGKFDGVAGALSSLSFILGALTSIIAGFLGMRIAVFSNGRVTLAAAKQGELGMREAFNVAFKGGVVMGFGT